MLLIQALHKSQPLHLLENVGYTVFIPKSPCAGTFNSSTFANSENASRWEERSQSASIVSTISGNETVHHMPAEFTGLAQEPYYSHLVAGCQSVPTSREIRGETYDDNRTAELPSDRQIRYAVGAQYHWSERLTIGGAFEYIDLGDARINNPTILTGEYEDNRLFVIALNLSYKF